MTQRPKPARVLPPADLLEERGSTGALRLASLALTLVAAACSTDAGVAAGVDASDGDTDAPDALYDGADGAIGEDGAIGGDVRDGEDEDVSDLGAPWPDDGLDACARLGVPLPADPVPRAEPDGGPAFREVREQYGIDPVRCVTAAVGDLNGDGAEDIFAPCAGNGQVASVYLQCGDGRFHQVELPDRVDTYFPEIGVLASAVVDVNHDGRLDIIVGVRDRVVALVQEPGFLFRVEPIMEPTNLHASVSGLVPLPGPTGAFSTLVVLRLPRGSDAGEAAITWSRAYNPVYRREDDAWVRIEQPEYYDDSSHRFTYMGGFRRTPAGDAFILVNDSGGPTVAFPWDGMTLGEPRLPDEQDARAGTGMGLASVSISTQPDAAAGRVVYVAETAKMTTWSITDDAILNGAHLLELSEPEIHNYYAGVCTYFDSDALPDCVFGEGVGGVGEAREQPPDESSGIDLTSQTHLHFARGTEEPDGTIRLVEEMVDEIGFTPGEIDSFGGIRVARAGNLCDLLLVTPHPLQPHEEYRLYETPCERDPRGRLGVSVTPPQEWTLTVELDDGRVVSADNVASEGMAAAHAHARMTIGLGDATPVRAELHFIDGTRLDLTDELGVDRLIEVDR